MVTAQTTEEERDAWETAPLSEQRKFYDLAPPTMPASIDYEPYSWAESELITLARVEGLPTATVRGLRDEGVRLGMLVDGRPLDDETVDAALWKFALTEAQMSRVKGIFRAVEGGGAA